MFQPARMNKLQALVLDEQKNTVIKKLHELGAVQILREQEGLVGWSAELLPNYQW